MNWQEALEEIQSIEFDANLNVVSGTNAFFRAVSQDSAVMEACREMLQSGEAREEVLGRIYDLVGQEIDPSFENPNDTPLAVLLWLTNFAAPSHAERAATWVDVAPGCWYAKKLAQRILNPLPSSTGDSKFGKPSASPIATGVMSREVKFRSIPNMAGPFQSSVSNSRVTSSTPVAAWVPKSQLESSRSEGMS